MTLGMDPADHGRWRITCTWLREHRRALARIASARTEAAAHGQMALQLDAPACELCDDEWQVDCPTCEGAGCASCHDTGRVDCACVGGPDEPDEEDDL